MSLAIKSFALNMILYKRSISLGRCAFTSGPSVLFYWISRLLLQGGGVATFSSVNTNIYSKPEKKWPSLYFSSKKLPEKCVHRDKCDHPTKNAGVLCTSVFRIYGRGLDNLYLKLLVTKWMFWSMMFVNSSGIFIRSYSQMLGRIWQI